MKLYLSQSKSAVFTALVLSACLISAGANAAGPKTATAKQKAAWENEWTKKVGIQLEYDLDSSGPDAWDSKEHPLVFVTTEGPGYGGLLSGVTLPGLAIIDADTREVVASQSYDLLSWGWKNIFEPHGLGVSPDGKWIYLPTGEGSFTTTTGGHAGRFLVINARTLKIDKVIQLSGQAHHAKSYRSPEGEQRVMLYGWSQPLFVLDPDNDNRAVGSISHQEQGSEGYLYFASPNGDKIIGTGRYRDFDMRKHLTDNPIWIIDPQSWHIKKFISVPDSAPVWVNFTSDEKFAYITGARNSIVMKLDLEEGERSLPNNVPALTVRMAITSAGTIAISIPSAKERSHTTAAKCWAWWTRQPWRFREPAPWISSTQAACGAIMARCIRIRRPTNCG